MRRWWFNCPHCGARLMQGTGYNEGFPKIWLPFFRCSICGQLISTGSREYVNIPLEERLKIRANLKNSEEIASSLDRTNSEKYKKFLQFYKLEFYPITEQDQLKFKNVDWDKYKNNKASLDAIQLLYDLGIFVNKELLDEKTGGIKQEITKENQRNYRINKVSKTFGRIAGILAGCITCGIVNPNDKIVIFVLFFVAWIIAFFAVAWLTSTLLHKSMKDSAQKPNSNNNVPPTSQGKLKSPWDIVEAKEQEDIPAVSEYDQDECGFH